MIGVAIFFGIFFINLAGNKSIKILYIESSGLTD